MLSLGAKLNEPARGFGKSGAPALRYWSRNSRPRRSRVTMIDGDVFAAPCCHQMDWSPVTAAERSPTTKSAGSNAQTSDPSNIALICSRMEMSICGWLIHFTGFRVSWRTHYSNHQ